ncbi:MAG: NVEALA domain-containing protein [Clostridia bacterium]|nr:NVEALA domain-containing protein [Clostridia bacterium]
MKKSFLLDVLALTLLTTAGWGVSKTMQGDTNLSDLALSNVEALAQNENGGDGSCSQSSDSWYEELGCIATSYSCNDGTSSSCIEGLAVSCPDGSRSNETSAKNCGR